MRNSHSNDYWFDWFDGVIILDVIAKNINYLIALIVLTCLIDKSKTSNSKTDTTYRVEANDYLMFLIYLPAVFLDLFGTPSFLQ